MKLLRLLLVAVGLVALLATGCVGSGSDDQPTASSPSNASELSEEASPQSEDSEAPGVAVDAFVERWNMLVSDAALKFQQPELRPVEEDPSKRSFVVEVTAQINVSVVVPSDDEVIQTALLGFPQGYPDGDDQAREAFAAFVRAINPALTAESADSVVQALLDGSASGDPAQEVDNGLRYVFIREADQAIVFAGRDPGPVDFSS